MVFLSRTSFWAGWILGIEDCQQKKKPPYQIRTNWAESNLLDLQFYRNINQKLKIKKEMGGVGSMVLDNKNLHKINIEKNKKNNKFGLLFKR